MPRANGVKKKRRDSWEKSLRKIKRSGDLCPEASKSLKQWEGLRHGWMSDSLMKEAYHEGNYTHLSALLLPCFPPTSGLLSHH